jgi:hypothetical protein
MNSFNLAVCFAPNIIYTKVSKCNDLYINEERIVVQLLIENSSSIGRFISSAAISLTEADFFVEFPQAKCPTRSTSDR